jgi:hypothetical protein
METTNQIEVRACKKCRHWVPKENANGECRAGWPSASPNTSVNEGTVNRIWPTTKPEDFCSKFNPAVGRCSFTTKVSDEAIIQRVREMCTPRPGEMPDGSDTPACAYKRSHLVDEIVGMGISRTPALKRIEKLVRNGTFQQGDNPWPRKYPTPGIHIWIDVAAENAAKGATKEPSRAENEAQFLSLIQGIAFNEETAKSLREIQRELEPQLHVSHVTIARRIGPLVAAGEVVRCPKGYYAAAACPTAEVPLEVE